MATCLLCGKTDRKELCWEGCPIIVCDCVGDDVLVAVDSRGVQTKLLNLLYPEKRVDEEGEDGWWKL